MGNLLLITLSIVLSYSAFSSRMSGQEMSKEDRTTIDAVTARYFRDSNNPSVAFEFFAAFLKLPPKARVDLWLRDAKRSHLTEGNVKDVMIIHGLDAVPNLLDVVRTRKGEDRLLALHLLCDMDRFVPMEDVPLKVDFGTVRDWSSQDSKDRGRNGGILSLATLIDGKRIGTQAKEFIYWAAQQSEDMDLRFHAREHSGLLYQDLKALPLEELIRQWRFAVSKAGKSLGPFYYSNDTILVHHIDRVLMENIDTTVPAMIKILAGDEDAYVRDAAFFFLYRADVYGMRLRRFPAGQRAIGAMRQALEDKRLRPENCTQNARYSVWQGFVSQAFDDKTMLGDVTFLSVVAMAFAEYDGEKSVAVPVDDKIRTKAYAVSPEMKRFVTYLTEIDPSFPSWGFTLEGLSGYEAIVHPRFRQKIELYYGYWKQFKANQFVVPEEKLDPELLKLKMPIGEPTNKVGRSGTSR